MSIYSLDKLMAETKKIAAAYYINTGQALPISNEIASYTVKTTFGFESPTENERGVDLIGTGDFAGLKIQVKARVIFKEKNNTRQRIGQVDKDGKWDVIILVIMNPTYEATEMYLLERKVILADLTHHQQHKSPKGALSLAKAKAIGKLIWANDSLKE